MRVDHGNDLDRVDIRALFRNIWQRRRLILIAVTIGAVLAGLGVSRMTPLYMSGAKVMLDSRKIYYLTDKAIISDLDVTEQVVNSEVAVLRSNILIESVIAEIGAGRLVELDPKNRSVSLPDRVKQLVGLEVKTPAGKSTVQTAYTQKVERLVFAIRKSMSVRRESKSLVIGISVETADPVLSKILAEAISQKYISLQLDEREAAAQRATMSIEDQVAVMKNQVALAEIAVQEYRTNSLIVEGSSAETSAQQVLDLNTSLTLARATYASAKARYEHLENIIVTKGVKAAESLVTTPLLDSLKVRRVELLQNDAVWAENYDENHRIRKRLAKEIAQLDADIADEISAQIEVIRGEADTARNIEISLSASLNELEQRVAYLSNKELAMKELESKATALRETYEVLLTRLAESRAQETFQRADAKLIERATIPGAPSFPRPKLIVALGSMGGLVVGLGMVFFLVLSGVTFRSESELENETGLPVYSSIPAGNWSSPRDAYRNLQISLNSVFAERVRHLRTALQVSDGQSILVTSSVAGEGKTTTTISLAKMFAQAGKSVIIIDCDLRRASMNQIFNWQMDFDMIDFINNECSLGDAIFTDQSLDFDLLGPIAPDPSVVDELSDGWLQSMVSTLTKYYDIVLLDAPPVLSVSEPILFSKVVDKAIYLVRWDSTPRSAVLKGLHSLSEFGTKPTGLVFTMVDPEADQMEYADEYAYAV
ncbi:MAG: polysaccharide biosynthesis tyrosine autokinase [Alphaproteobacteria bacterium]|nr:polysaccharide biosynthesis tyrosine autokinase [Alphaproteobacteria bacterium]